MIQLLKAIGTWGRVGVGGLVGWLNLLNTELPPYWYLLGLGSQKEGKEEDYSITIATAIHVCML